MHLGISCSCSRPVSQNASAPCFGYAFKQNHNNNAFCAFPPRVCPHKSLPVYLFKNNIEKHLPQRNAANVLIVHYLRTSGRDNEAGGPGAAREGAEPACAAIRGEASEGPG